MKKNLRKFTSFTLMSAVAVSLIVPDSVQGKSVAKLSATKLSIVVGKKKTLKVKNSKKKVTWSIKSGKKYISFSSKKKSSAVIKGKKAGKASVQAKVGGKKLLCKVTVKKKVTIQTKKTTSPTTTPSTQVTPTKNPTGEGQATATTTALVTSSPMVTVMASPTATATVAPTTTPTLAPVQAILRYSETGKKVTGCENKHEATYAVIPEGVTEIGDYAFHDCTSLTSITIPSSVTKIYKGVGLFWGCNGLEEINVDENNTVYRSENNCVIDKETNGLILGCKNSKIPSSITEIGDYAFSGCTGLTSITIPSSVTKIGYYAFFDCTGLTSITIPSSVTEIFRGAFYGCTGLTSITIPSSVTEIDFDAFRDCTGLTSITIPSSVTEIGCNVFDGCTGLTSITIPSSVTTILGDAFRGCTGLTSITIPSSVTTIFGDAFGYCSGLEEINVEENNTVYRSENNCIIDKETNGLILGCKNSKIPSSVTTIGDNAFDDCTSLTSITIPSSVTKIGKWAFYNCTGLTSITIPSSVTEIGYAAFRGCTGLASITIPSSVTEIGDDAFSGCSGLQEIHWNGNVYNDYDEFITAFTIATPIPTATATTAPTKVPVPTYTPTVKPTKVPTATSTPTMLPTMTPSPTTTPTALPTPKATPVNEFVYEGGSYRVNESETYPIVLSSLNETTFSCKDKRPCDASPVADNVMYNTKEGSVSWTSRKDFVSGLSFYINPCTSDDDVVDISEMRGEGFYGYLDGTKDMSAYDYVRIKLKSSGDMNFRTYCGNKSLTTDTFPGQNDSECYEFMWAGPVAAEDYMLENDTNIGYDIKEEYVTRTVFIPTTIFMERHTDMSQLTAIALSPQQKDVDVTLYAIDFVKVYYENEVDAIKLSSNKSEIYNWKTAQLKAQINPENATRKIVKWTSSNEELATVDYRGIVIAAPSGTGTVTFTATATDGSGVSATIDVKIISVEDPPAQDIDIPLNASGIIAKTNPGEGEMITCSAQSQDRIDFPEQGGMNFIYFQEYLQENEINLTEYSSLEISCEIVDEHGNVLTENMENAEGKFALVPFTELNGYSDGFCRGWLQYKAKDTVTLDFSKITDIDDSVSDAAGVNLQLFYLPEGYHLAILGIKLIAKTT